MSPKPLPIAGTPERCVGNPADKAGARKRGWMRWECSIIGSADGVSLQLRSALVEPMHCAILRVGDGYELWDLNSRAGTYLNETRIVRARLSEGDRIRIGPYKMRFAGEPGKAPVQAPVAGVQAAPLRRADAAKPPAALPKRPASSAFAPVKSGAHTPAKSPADDVPTAAKPPLRTAPLRSPDSSGLVNTLDPAPASMHSDLFDTADLLFASLGQSDVQAEIVALRRQVAEQKRLISRLVGGPEEPAPAKDPVEGFVDIERQLKALRGDEPTGVHPKPGQSPSAPPAAKP